MRYYAMENEKNEQGRKLGEGEARRGLVQVRCPYVMKKKRGGGFSNVQSAFDILVLPVIAIIPLPPPPQPCQWEAPL